MVLKIWMVIFCAGVLVIALGSSLPVNDVADNSSVTAKIDQSNGKIDYTKDNDTLSNEFNTFISKVEKVITDIYLDNSNATFRKFVKNLTEIFAYGASMLPTPPPSFVLKLIAQQFFKEIKNNATLDEISQILHNPLIKDVLENDFKIINILREIEKDILTQNNTSKKSKCEKVEKNYYNTTDSKLVKPNGFIVIKLFIRYILYVACSDNGTKFKIEMSPSKLTDTYFTLLVIDAMRKFDYPSFSDFIEWIDVDITTTTEKNDTEREEKHTQEKVSFYGYNSTYISKKYD